MRRLLLALCALIGTVAAAQAAERCGVCHPESRVEFVDSLHAREEVTCSGCHGGNPASNDVDAAHRGGFRALTDRLVVPAACAECHADLDRMRPYNLPVDQYAIYLTSQHGRANSRGERRAAICTDCHGAHRILAPDDPESPAHPRRLIGTCGRCHGDAALMNSFGIDPNVVDDYRAGVHGLALLERGRSAAPNCTSCHGVHGAAPPGYGDVDKVCGACHAETRSAYVAGPHHDAMRDAGLPECVSCHEHHAVRSLDAERVDLQCEQCHDDGTEQVRTGREMTAVLAAAREEVEAAAELVDVAQRAALHVEDHLSRLEEARTYLTEALPLVHTARLEPVEEMTRRSISIAEEVQHELYRKLDRRPARIGLAVFWFYLVMTLAVLVVYKRRVAAGGE